METVAREFFRRNIVPDGADLGALDQKVSDHVAELLPRLSDLLALVQKRHKFGVVAPVGVVDGKRVGLEHSFESLASVAGLVPDAGEMFEMAIDLTFVPGDQDRFGV